jgi:Fe-S-cluster containining protein
MRLSRAKRIALRALHALYAELPRIECQGKCQASCHVTADLFVELEIEQLADKLGHEPGFMDESRMKVGDDLSMECTKCPLLKAGRCAEYCHRPLMCRLWGVVADPLMVCPFGCRPTRYLSNDEVRRLYARLTEINERYLAESGAEQ